MVVDHQNWFGLDDTMGPVAISIKREKVDAVLSQFENNCNFSSGSSVTQLCRYRLIVRSTEVSNGVFLIITGTYFLLKKVS